MNRIELACAGHARARHGRGGWGVCLLLALGPLLAGAAQAQPVSAAEVLLFEADHLARTGVPAALVYDFRKVSNAEPGFTDTVELNLTRENGRMHARLRFLSGERKRELPDIDDAHGNPVLLGFLEHDIAEMKRLTGGSVTYFRKRIRMALANAGPPERQTISFKGKPYDARTVRIQPYLNDPLHARFEPYVNKTYTLVFSEAVPGGLYQLSTTLGNSGGGRAVSATAGGVASGAAGKPASVLADGSVAKRPEGQAVPGGMGPGVRDTGQAKAGTAKPGSAAVDRAGPAASAVADASSAGTAVANGAAVSNGAAASAARSGAQGAGAGSAKAALVIEETLTLVKVADPKR